MLSSQQNLQDEVSNSSLWPTECSVSLQSSSTSDFPRCRFAGNVASLFIGLTPQDPLAQAFGQSPFSLSNQCRVCIQLNSPPLGVSSQPSLAVAANCSHVPSDLVYLIVAGQYVDFTLLLQTSLSKLPSCMPNDVQLARLLRNDLAKILNFRD